MTFNFDVLQVVTSLDDTSQAQEVSGNGGSGNGNIAVAACQLLCALVPETPFDKPQLQSRLQDIVGYVFLF